MIINGAIFVWECIWQETVTGRMKMASVLNVEDDSTTEHSSSNINDISGSVATSKSIQNEVDYPPLVIVNVKSTDGVWIQANCFLDMGSDTTLVRKDLVNNLGLPELGSSKLRFGTAGGNVHEEFSKDLMLEVKPLKSSEVSFTIVASSIEKPCFDVCPIPASVVNQYKLFSSQNFISLLIFFRYNTDIYSRQCTIYSRIIETISLLKRRLTH